MTHALLRAPPPPPPPPEQMKKHRCFSLSNLIGPEQEAQANRVTHATQCSEITPSVFMKNV